MVIVLLLPPFLVPKTSHAAARPSVELPPLLGTGRNSADAFGWGDARLANLRMLRSTQLVLMFEGQMTDPPDVVRLP